MSVSQPILFALGLMLLYYGAGWLVKGASALARGLGLAPITIGLTIVAFGTSSPELVVSLVSALKGKSMIALGNVVGSNICNLSLVLGLTAIFYPVATRRVVIARDIPVMLLVSVLLLLFSANGIIGRGEGIVLFAGIVAYTVFNYQVAVRVDRLLRPPGERSGDCPERPSGGFRQTAFQSLMVLGGTAAVVAGADLLVDAAVGIMSALGVDEKVVGLTVVAFGTSVPELATSVVAALKREMEISLGNLVGSNVFNIFSVVGATAMVRPIVITGGFIGSGIWVDYLAMMAVSVLPWILMRRTLTVSRAKGFFLCGCYLAYVGFLFVKT